MVKPRAGRCGRNWYRDSHWANLANHGLCAPVCWTRWLFGVWCKENGTAVTLGVPWRYFTSHFLGNLSGNMLVVINFRQDKRVSRYLDIWYHRDTIPLEDDNIELSPGPNYTANLFTFFWGVAIEHRLMSHCHLFRLRDNTQHPSYFLSHALLNAGEFEEHRGQELGDNVL